MPEASAAVMARDIAVIVLIAFTANGDEKKKTGIVQKGYAKLLC